MQHIQHYAMAETAEKSKVHHGHNLLLLRKKNGEKQDTIAKAYGCNQQRISQLESQETITDDVLQWFADHYGLELEDIRDKEIELSATPIEVHNNTFQNGGYANFGDGYHNKDNIYNSEELILKLMEEKDKERERLIQVYERIIQLEEQQKEELKKLLSKK